MAIETYEALCDLVRSHLADTDTIGGDLFTDDFIEESFGSAWDELIGLMSANQIPAAERVWFHTLPAYTVRLDLALAGITDIESIVSIKERASPVSIAAVASLTADPDNEIVIGTIGHGQTIGSLLKIIVADVEGVPAANGLWYGEFPDANNIILKGSTFSALWTSGGLIYLDSGGAFTDVDPQDDLLDRSLDTNLQVYSREDNALHFIGASVDVQLRIKYLTDNSAPGPGESLIYPGIKNPLAARTAAILAYPRNRPDALRLDKEARGPALDGDGGLYYTFLAKKVRELQKLPFARRMYGRKGVTNYGNT